MESIFSNWLMFKAICTSKNLGMQYFETTQKYILFAYDEGIKYESELWKDTTIVEGLDVAGNNTDLADFEANYKAVSNKPIVPKTVERLPKVLMAVSVDDVSLYVTGTAQEVSGTAENLVSTIDSDFNGDIQLQGMTVMVKGAEWGDSVNVEVGYLVGGAFTSLKKFGENVPMRDEANWQVYEYKNNAVSKIPDSLIVRVIYHHANPITVKKVVLHYITHK